MAHRRNRDGVVRAGEVRIVDVPVILPVIASRGHDVGAEPAAAVIDRTVDPGEEVRRPRSVLLVGGKRGDETPGMVDHVEVLLGAHGLAEQRERVDGERVDAHKRRIIGDADRAAAVVLRGDDTRHSRAVIVGRSAWRRTVNTAAEHNVLRCVIVVIEIVMGELDAVVINRNGHPGAGIVVPNAGNVEIDAGNTAALSGVLQVPLIAEQIV